MNQEEARENLTANEKSSDSPNENLEMQDPADSLSAPVSSEEIENLPVESIGSYARLEELLTDEKAEKTGNPVSQS